MDCRAFAVNYNAVSSIAGKSDSYCISLFEKAQSLAGEQVKTVPLFSLSKLWTELLGTDEKTLVNAWDRASRAMDNLSPDTLVMHCSDPRFPSDVKDTPFLYLRGHVEFLSQDGVCVVGTRNPSDRGASLTKAVVSSLSKKFVIISGLAMGVDGIAHIQALSEGQRTIAVIGTPVNEYYPAQHRKLQDLISQEGLLVSRFYPSQTVQKYFFMMRNLLMSQIGRASFVVESQDGGGGVSQAQYSEKQGKSVLVLKETYENRTFLWPRKLKNPVIVPSPERSLSCLEKALKEKTSEDEQLLLF